ncbi:MAG: tRNA pseudouridine(55) synthase TruB [Bacteroidales bacterium]|nr:tRNA pseudouridine(55) synthase TruB [Bacteroidales bacterium]MBD5229966.1 tRNA pseudouridine(55) synthase TruB [Bacteroidales bacterium]MBD5235088.1 tRNA pseudouridine(55) synthase TruB [Barnesiella sp.]MBD5247849.1 tRNA pseudouridine(55) synthase TruB [Barnesiella sp.]
MNFLAGETICIDKPYGWTSFDVVKRIRGVMLRRTGVKKMKVGHAGTLDPLATGVMIVVSGKSTKLIEQLQSGVKEYIATIALGATTPSFDLETEIDARYPIDHITEQQVSEVLTRFTGRIEQVPPAFSACKVDGKRAYKMARKGDVVELKPKVLVIDEIELLDFAQHSITIRVVCSKGTYIRALARDIGAALGSGGHLTALRRTRVGDVSIDNCLSLDAAVEMLRTVDVEMPDEDNKTDNTDKK